MKLRERIVKAWAVLTRPEDMPVIDALDLTKVPVDFEGGKSYQEAQKIPDYAVTGTPRHVPWSRRKKELEASARKKRQQRDEFRSQA